MDRTIWLLVLVVLIGACSAGNGYNYIKPANNVANIGPVVNSDGSTKSVHFFADSDDHQRVQQQRPISYAKSVPYSRPTTTYSQPTPQPSRIVYNRVAPQQSYVAPQQSYAASQKTYVAPQQSYVTSQKSYVAPQQSYFAPQQSTITYNQAASQQKPITYSQIAPQQLQQQISFGSNQIASQQLPFLTSQTFSQQSPLSYNQVALQQQPILYNQILPQQLPITYTQVAPLQQQLYYSNYPTAPLRQNLQVVFVRTPGYEAYTEALLKMAKEAIQSQSQTIVYVLSKEPDIAELTRRFKEIQATGSKMPEVRFIKYKTDDEAVQAQQAIKAQYEGLPGTSNTIGTPLGTEIGTGTQTESESETGSINYSSGAASETSSSLSTAAPTNNEDDSYSENFPPYVPNGVDVVPGSSYLPPYQKTK